LGTRGGYEGKERDLLTNKPHQQVETVMTFANDFTQHSRSPYSWHYACTVSLMQKCKKRVCHQE